MRYSIIVAVDNNYALTNNFIENLLSTTDIEKDGELIIILDGCENITTIKYLEGLTNRGLPIKVLQNRTKLGYGKANNIAVNSSHGDILLFINSDVFPIKDSIVSLVSYLEKNICTVGAVQGLLIYPQNNKVQSTGHLFIDLQNTHVYQGADISNPIIKIEGTRQALCSAYCAIPRTIFYKHGMFNEYYYNAYEGFELTLNISYSGLKCMYYPNAVAYHIASGTRNNMNISETQQGKYFIQNWGNKIKTDIDRYLLPQLDEHQLKAMYTVIVMSQLKGWEDILTRLKLNINGYIYELQYGTTNLYQLFPYSFLNFGGNYLFIVDTVNDISQNHNWIKNRKGKKDIVMDSHANILRLKDLV